MSGPTRIPSASTRRRWSRTAWPVSSGRLSETGQRWGNPLYRWAELKQRGYDWWVKRMSWALESCDIIHLDHFRGFQQYWEIPNSEPTAVHGRWVDGPGEDLFRVLRGGWAICPSSPKISASSPRMCPSARAAWSCPGMRVLQFGFGDPGAHIYLPHRYQANTVVYTGTHDNDTTLGWWKSCWESERRFAEALLGNPATASTGLWFAWRRAPPPTFAWCPCRMC